MDFKINRDEFLDALSKTQSVVERKNTMPVLSNVLLEATKNELKISATDLEVAIYCSTPAQVNSEGKITVFARSLFDIVKEISNSEINIQLKENDRIEVTAGLSRFNIPGLAANEFPQMPEVEGKTIDVECEKFLNLLQKTSFAMSTDETTRHHLAGVFLQKLDDSTLRMVATDGHRLALLDQPIATRGLGDTKVIIPKKGVAELKKLIGGSGSFELAIGKKNLLAKKGNQSLFIRLVEGDYPDYKRVIPENNTKMALVPKSALVGALRRVSLLSNERSRGVVFGFSPAHLEVFINNPDLGEAREELEIDYKNERLNIGFNAKYFLEALDVVKDDIIALALQSDLTPCLLKGQNEPSFTYVIMPMRI